MEHTATQTDPIADGHPLKAARALSDAADLALNELGKGIAGGLSPLELVRECRIRQACARLVECGEELAGAELTVAGSTRQLRPHPLLKLEQELRKEITDGLQTLEFRATQRAMVERLNGKTRRKGTSKAKVKP
jgi:hypothetical protein